MTIRGTTVAAHTHNVKAMSDPDMEIKYEKKRGEMAS